jgi:hypothetical protein
MDGSSTDEVPETEDEDTFDVFADYDVAHEGLPDANNEEEEAQEGPAHAPNNAPTFDVGADALFDDESGDSYDEEEDEDEEEEDEDEEEGEEGDDDDVDESSWSADEANLRDEEEVRQLHTQCTRCMPSTHGCASY